LLEQVYFSAMSANFFDLFAFDLNTPEIGSPIIIFPAPDLRSCARSMCGLE
jgi:hypothetical protein